MEIYYCPTLTNDYRNTQFLTFLLFTYIVEIPTQKGRVLLKMHRVVPQTKRGDYICNNQVLLLWKSGDISRILQHFIYH